MFSYWEFTKCKGYYFVQKLVSKFSGIPYTKVIHFFIELTLKVSHFTFCVIKVEEKDEELAAWKFTPDSASGKRLMARYSNLIIKTDYCSCVYREFVLEFI